MIPLLPAEWVVWIARMTLGLTLLVSGLGKLGDLDGVVIGVLGYEIGPPRTMRRLAPLLPLAELLLAVLLLGGFAVRWAAAGASLLVAVFAMAVIVKLRRDRPIACHCYGTSADERIGVETLLRLLVLGVAGVIVAAGSPAATNLPPAAASRADSLRLAGIAVYAAGALRMLGPAATLWRDVLATRRDRRPHRAVSRERQRGLRMERGAGAGGAARPGGPGGHAGPDRRGAGQAAVGGSRSGSGTREAVVAARSRRRAVWQKGTRQAMRMVQIRQ